LNWYIAQNFIAVAEKVAIIDCGTNTFHLMIVSIEDGSTNVIFKEKVAVKIGEGGINKKIIQPAAIDRALTTIKYFNSVIIEHNVKRTYGFATSAFRNAENGNLLKDLILKKTSIEINIISGDREAQLIFNGVNNALNIGENPALVMDIGGGSVEFIIGSSSKVYWKGSFEIGAQRLVDLFHKTDPINNDEINELNSYLEIKLPELSNALNQWKPKTLVGSSGTFDTLSDIYSLKEGLIISEDQTEVPLTLAAYWEIHKEIIQKNRLERLRIPGMIEMRVDMIVVASILINFILVKYPFENLRASTHALKEGVLAEILNGEI
jgi:exopolyphosphatase / guanosine-5'-triphosphate,3'-diphosphate pyrophosphatase